MKKYILLLIIVLVISNIMPMPAFAAEDMTKETGIVVSNDGRNQVITITGEENIKVYQASLGETYDPNLIAVKRTINNTYSNRETDITPFFIFREYYIKNKKVTTSTDFSEVLRKYNRPAGKVKISQGVSITTSYNAEAGISAKLLESKLGFSVSSTDTFQIEWEGTYSYPVTLKVYPIYQNITGEIWDEDIKYDDFVGKFTVKRALGDDVRVYRQ